MRHRLDPLLIAKAGLTPKEVEALELWDPDPAGAGYWSVALALGIAKETARDRVKRGLRRLADVQREEFS